MTQKTYYPKTVLTQWCEEKRARRVPFREMCGMIRGSTGRSTVKQITHRNGDETTVTDYTWPNGDWLRVTEIYPAQ